MDSVRKKTKSLTRFDGLQKIKKVVDQIKNLIKVFRVKSAQKLLKDAKNSLDEKRENFSGALESIERKRKKTIWHHAVVFTKNHSRHTSLFLVGAIVLIGNLLAGGNIEIVNGDQVVSGQNVDEAAAPQVPVSEKDLAGGIQTISKYTPLVKVDAQKIASIFSEQITLTMGPDGYISKPKILGVAMAKEADVSLTGSSSGRLMQTYVVRNGESLGSIANKFGLKVATFKNCNNIPNANVIQPGSKLLIPPTDGLIHKVALGENLIKIVNYYHGSFHQTKDLNRLASDILYVGQRLFVADGKAQPVRLAQRSSGSASSNTGPVYHRTGPNHFPYGWCTYYVASRRYVPWHGDAREWSANARAMGYSTGRTPRVGAIMVTYGGWWGHVAYVEAVNGNSVTISEMNYVGWGRIDRRTVSAWYGIYIY